MQRYTKKSEVQIGHRVMFDNNSNFIIEFPNINIIGDVKEISKEENVDDIIIGVFRQGIDHEILLTVPYYTLQ